MTVLLAVASRDYPAGTQPIPSTAIPAGLSSVRLTLTRESWPDTGGDVISMLIDLSLDGGATWTPGFLGFTAPGGVLFDRLGNVRATSSAFRDLPEPANANRRVRGTVTLLSPLRTAVTIEGA